MKESDRGEIIPAWTGNGDPENYDECIEWVKERAKKWDLTDQQMAELFCREWFREKPTKH